jgi:hypothetical protein
MYLDLGTQYGNQPFSYLTLCIASECDTVVIKNAHLSDPIERGRACKIMNGYYLVQLGFP